MIIISKIYNLKMPPINENREMLGKNDSDMNWLRGSGMMEADCFAAAWEV